MKSIKILVMICIILISTLGIKIYISNKDVNSYSKEDVINLLEKGNKYNNYYCKYTLMDNNEIMRFVKGEKQKIIGNDLIIQIDRKENKKLILKPSTKTGVMMNLDSKANLESINNYLSDFLEDIKENAISFKFDGRENINIFNCIVVEVTFEKDYIYNSKKVWIDNKSGLIVKTLIEMADHTKWDIDYNLKLDSVIDSDVEISNLSEFNITNIE